MVSLLIEYLAEWLNDTYSNTSNKAISPCLKFSNFLYKIAELSEMHVHQLIAVVLMFASASATHNNQTLKCVCSHRPHPHILSLSREDKKVTFLLLHPIILILLVCLSFVSLSLEPWSFNLRKNCLGIPSPVSALEKKLLNSQKIVKRLGIGGWD